MTDMYINKCNNVISSWIKCVLLLSYVGLPIPIVVVSAAVSHDNYGITKDDETIA